jgi:predicted dehydrogenase
MTVEQQSTARRDFLKVGAAAFTTSIFTGNVKGANDRLAGAVIGIGRMGSANLEFAIKQPNVEVVAVCDIYQPHLEDGLAIAAKLDAKPKPVKDFREILADKSIDFVNISTPDHWHAYMTVEACKAGKDVYCEKPICTHLEEGKKMVEAARKYNRVVQAGTMQRSGEHFKKAVEIVKSGALGKITLCRTWINGASKPEGIGNPADSTPPAGLDWDMWLGPAANRPFNENRWGVHPEMTENKPFPYFRYFWDYAGGMMTDWGVHLLDIMHFAFDEPLPKTITAVGGKWWVTDNRDTPDTLMVTYEYPQDFVATFEAMTATGQSPYPSGPGTLFCGTKGQLFVSRSIVQITPEKGSDLEAQEIKPSNNMNMAHWANFMDCIKTRQKPISDVETCFKTTAACQLGNAAYRSKLRLDWDAAHATVAQKEARQYLAYEYRKPWKLVV